MKFKDFFKEESPSGSMFEAMSDKIYQRGRGEQLERLGSEARLVYLVLIFEGGIFNGGFHQLFIDMEQGRWVELQDYLGLLKAEQSLSLLNRAVALFPGGVPPEDPKERADVWTDISESIEGEELMFSLDDEFYEGADQFRSLIDAYIRSNPEAVVLVS